MVSVDGGTTKDPLILYYRDGEECFERLFEDPCYKNDMDYGPRREFTAGEERERLYNEIMTGDMAWNLQVKMPFFYASERKVMIFLSPGTH